MKIRNLEEGDIPAITAIYNYHVLNTTVVFETEPFSEDKMRGIVGDIASRFPYIVAEIQGELVGFAYVHPWKTKPLYSSTVESTLYVREDMKGRGVGASLLEELVRRCREKGFHAMVACITAENQESLRFHEKHGFRKVSYFKEVGRKFSRWLDIVDCELLL